MHSGWDVKVLRVTCLDRGLPTDASGSHTFQKDVIRLERLNVINPFPWKWHKMFSLQHFPIPRFPFGKEIIGINISPLYSFLI